MQCKKIKLWSDRPDVYLRAYLPDDGPGLLAGRPRPAVILCPGGAYQLCAEKEGEPAALQFAAMGYHAFVLHYSVYGAASGTMGFAGPGSPVCEKTLCTFSKELGIDKVIRLGKGETRTGGAERPSILADAFESVLAAVYLDGGIEPAKKIVLRFITREGIDEARRDYKTMLQEVVQKHPEEAVEYFVVDERGPDHDKEFTVEVHLNSNVIGSGTGRSKKLAEQAAAREAQRLMGLKE